MNPFLAGNEYEELTTTTTASKDSDNQTDYQNHNTLGPQMSLLYRLLVSVQVKCKTHTQQSTISTLEAETVNLTLIL